MDIVISGSVAFDYLMKFPGLFRDHILPDRLEGLSLSFLVESMVRHQGGTGPNIAYTLALLGGRPRLMATVGEDFQTYREWLEAHGVDTRDACVIPGEFTASFFVNTDRSNAQIASFYPGAMAYAGDCTVEALAGGRPDLVVISPNDPKAMIGHAEECVELGIPYLYDPSQQIVRLDGEDLRRGVSGAMALFVNDYEFGLVQKHTGLSGEDIRALVDFMVITKGADGADLYYEDRVTNIPVVQPDQILDPTGVGDAFRGGFLTGYSHQLPLVLCAQMGALAATFCLEQSGPQAHTYTPVEFINRFRKYFDDYGRLNVLLESS